MKRHQVALIIALALLAAMASTSLVSGEFSAAARQDTPPTSVVFTIPDNMIEPALQSAKLIVRARVDQVISRWADDHSYLQSESTLTVHYALRGAVSEPLVVHTIGGFLPEENLAMVEMESPTLTVGEEVILLLAPTRTGYVIVGHHDGKFHVLGQDVRYAGSHHVESLALFYARLAQLGPGITLPEDWAAQEANLRQSASVTAADYIYNERKWATGDVPFYINLNSGKLDIGNGTTDDFLAAILNGAMAWTMVPGAEFILTYAGETETAAVAYDRTNNVFFIDKGLVDENGVRLPLATATVWFSNGIILDADITINDAYQWDATGQPERAEIDLESVVLHEFGHWLSLGHDGDSRAVMYYAITTGTLKRVLFDNDQRGIEFIYPCAAGQVCNPATTETPTATATPTSTATPTVTPTPTATSTPTPVVQIITQDAGGVVEYAPDADSHITLLVPPNSVVTDTVITIELTNVVPTPPANHHPLFGYFHVHVGPVGLEEGEASFQQPATLTVTYRMVAGASVSEGAMRLLTLDAATQSWVEIACEYATEGENQQRVTTMIEQPSVYGLFRVESVLYLPLTQR